MRHYDLPPLAQLEAFEAAARTLSFTKAADELSLTQSAISRQIKALEEHLELALFRRLHRALRLTEEGQTLYHAVSDVLAQLLRECGFGAAIVRQRPAFFDLWAVATPAAVNTDRLRALVAQHFPIET